MCVWASDCVLWPDRMRQMVGRRHFRNLQKRQTSCLLFFSLLFQTATNVAKQRRKGRLSSKHGLSEWVLAPLLLSVPSRSLAQTSHCTVDAVSQIVFSLFQICCRWCNKQIWKQLSGSTMTLRPLFLFILGFFFRLSENVWSSFADCSLNLYIHRVVVRAGFLKIEGNNCYSA